MILSYYLLLAFILVSLRINNSSPIIKTNCTSVESIDGSVGVDCVRSRQSDDPFDPTVIQQHFVDLFTRAKREANDESVSTPIPDLFVQNLAVMAQANMSDCMARVNCEEKCDYATRGILVKVNEEENSSEEEDEDLPDFVENFYEAGKKGIEFAKSGECGNCKSIYSQCNKMQYDYTVRTNSLYRDLIRRNISLFQRDPSDEHQIPEDIEYLHHSMRFLDLANLTKCYARVSCETTCRHVKEFPDSEAPPEKSPFLQNDPQKPESVDIIHEGAILGYGLAIDGLCDECADHYTDCPPDKYTIAHSSSIIFG